MQTNTHTTAPQATPGPLFLPLSDEQLQAGGVDLRKYRRASEILQAVEERMGPELSDEEFAELLDSLDTDEQEALDLVLGAEEAVHAATVPLGRILATLQQMSSDEQELALRMLEQIVNEGLAPPQ